MAIILDEVAGDLFDENLANFILDEAGGGIFTSDIPQIVPGPAWLRYFKPNYPRPFSPVLTNPSLQAAGHFTLAPLAFAANGARTFPDQPSVYPGPTWFDLFKPGMPRPRPSVPPLLLQAVNSSGSLQLSPLALRGVQVQRYLFTGHYALTYLDYVDSQTGRVLTCVPGGQFYTMLPVSSRHGLAVPPPDGRWPGETSFGANVVLQRRTTAVPGPHLHFMLITTPSSWRFAILTRRGVNAAKERRELAVVLSSEFTYVPPADIIAQISDSVLVICTDTGMILATFTFSIRQGILSGESMTLLLADNTTIAKNTGIASGFRIINSGNVILLQGSAAGQNLSSVLIHSGDSVSIIGPVISWTPKLISREGRLNWQ